MDIIESIRQSNKTLQQSQKTDLDRWKNLNHTKKDLETFLQFNIAEIHFKTKDGKLKSIVCTSNKKLANLLNSNTKVEKQKVINTWYPMVSTTDPFSVNTFDLIDNKIKTIRLSFWSIINFISIHPHNILALDMIIRNILKKQ